MSTIEKKIGTPEEVNNKGLCFKHDASAASYQSTENNHSNLYLSWTTQVVDETRYHVSETAKTGSIEVEVFTAVLMTREHELDVRRVELCGRISTNTLYNPLLAPTLSTNGPLSKLISKGHASSALL